jgi:hypothetical protein
MPPPSIIIAKKHSGQFGKKKYEKSLSCDLDKEPNQVWIKNIIHRQGLNGYFIFFKDFCSEKQTKIL